MRKGCLGRNKTIPLGLNFLKITNACIYDMAVIITITIIYKMIGMTNGMTTVAVKRSTQKLLKEIGRKGETYDEIINRLYRLARRQLFYERQKKILDEEEFVPLGKL